MILVLALENRIFFLNLNYYHWLQFTDYNILIIINRNIGILFKNFKVKYLFMVFIISKINFMIFFHNSGFIFGLNTQKEISILTI